MTTAQTTNLKDGPRPVKSQGGDAPASLGSNRGASVGLGGQAPQGMQGWDECGAELE